jgi:hypothetical protein
MAAKWYIDPVQRTTDYKGGDKGTVRVTLVAANGRELFSGEALVGHPKRHIEAIKRAIENADIVDRT